MSWVIGSVTLSDDKAPKEISVVEQQKVQVSPVPKQFPVMVTFGLAPYRVVMRGVCQGDIDKANIIDKWEQDVKNGDPITVETPYFSGTFIIQSFEWKITVGDVYEWRLILLRKA